MGSKSPCRDRPGGGIDDGNMIAVGRTAPQVGRRCGNRGILVLRRVGLLLEGAFLGCGGREDRLYCRKGDFLSGGGIEGS